MEAMLAAPILESPSGRQPTEESTAPAGGLGGDERLASTMDGSVAVPGATVEAYSARGVDSTP